MTRLLSLRGWIAVGVAAVALVVLVVGLVAVWERLTGWLPWSAESRLERRTIQRDAALAQASARSLESGGLAEQQTRLEAVHRVILNLETATAEAAAQARSAPDADQPLDPDRLDRLRRHDGELCRIAPHLAGCAAAPAAARPGD